MWYNISPGADACQQRRQAVYLFGISVVVQAKTGINKTVEISVAKDGDNQAELVNYPIGSRVEVAGVLQFHKKEMCFTSISRLRE